MTSKQSVYPVGCHDQRSELIAVVTNSPSNSHFPFEGLSFLLCYHLLLLPFIHAYSEGAPALYRAYCTKETPLFIYFLSPSSPLLPTFFSYSFSSNKSKCVYWSCLLSCPSPALS